MIQKPIYRPQGVNYLGFLSQELGDLVGKATLAHELIQNADDAKDDAGRLAATRITFDVTDEALLVSNDAVFRELDFERLSDIADGSKREEAGARTTGAFGIGFISVYQITDRPEIHSAGRRQILRPEYPQNERIEEWPDPLITHDTGTMFRLPWAFNESEVRTKLKVPPINTEYIDSFADMLKEILPRTILFLKKLERLELRCNGKLKSVATRRMCNDTIEVDHNGEVESWRILKGHFAAEAEALKSKYGIIIGRDRSCQIRIAVPNKVFEDGLLYATLPTEQSTRLPFHIDADFFPASDRKSIQFGDDYHRSEWNRAAIRAAAATVTSNLMTLRNLHGDDAASFWSFLQCLQRVQGDRHRPFNEFWEAVRPTLGQAPVVYTASGKWLVPECTRIFTGQQEEDAIGAFQELGIEMVHRNLQTYRNLLLSMEVGVRMLSASDVHHRFEVKGCTDRPVKSLPVDTDLLGRLWQGMESVLRRNTRGGSKLAICSVAPGLDDRLWPCHSAYQANEHTRDLFAQLIPADRTFLNIPDIPSDVSLFKQLCPEFTVSEAIETLELLDTKQNGYRDRNLVPLTVLEWFESHKHELTDNLLARLAVLPIFPSSDGRCCPLADLRLPGGFKDPTGHVDILDTSVLSGSLSDFLKKCLGAKTLTFEDYVTQYVSKAFDEGDTEPNIKRDLLTMLDRHIGEIKGNDHARNRLSETRIVECNDGRFRQPHTTYFRDKGVYEVLGNHANYALVPDNAVLRRDLYRWLGVQSRPRISDIRKIVKKATKTKPTVEAKSIVVKMIEILGLRWKELNDSEKHACRDFRSEAWLPADGDDSTWYRPNELFATFNKSLFATQGKFLDVPIRIQRNINDFLGWLDVNLSPKPFLVVRHLLECSVMSQKPPNGIYEWLNANSSARALHELTDAACLWVDDKYEYLRPNQVFWGSHPFGRHRVQLDAGLRSLQHLLEQLGVRQTPDFNDALNVLKELAEAVGSRVLEAEDENVVMQCWLMLSDALQEEGLEADVLNRTLQDVQCVPTEKGFLQLPSRMFFEDRSGLASKFPGPLGQNCISRTERAWVAMTAAGVRPVSEVVRGFVVDCVNSRKGEAISARVKARIDLIGIILEAADIPVQKKDILNSIEFTQVDTLTVRWTLKAFGRKWDTPSEPASAHWDKEKQVVFFVNYDDGIPPWSAIARELALALAPGKNLASMSPGLNTVLEAGTTNTAEEQLSDLGIASIHTSDREPVEGVVVHSLGSNASRMDDHGQVWTDLPNAPDNDQMSDGSGVSDGRFAQHIHDVQTLDPTPAPQHPHVLPVGGPKTSQSAKDYMDEAYRVDKAENYVVELVQKFQRGPKGQALEVEFRSMVHGDYGKRCQICNRTFVKPGGERQVNVIHVVPRKKDTLTNHLGALLGVCGWHFNLLQYGQWALLDPEVPFKDLDGSRGWERMTEFILNCTPDTDKWGNPFIGLPIRFANVYQEGKPEPTDVPEVIQYSIPHWTFLCELLKA